MVSIVSALHMANGRRRISSSGVSRPANSDPVCARQYRACLDGEYCMARLPESRHARMLWRLVAVSARWCRRVKQPVRHRPRATRALVDEPHAPALSLIVFRRCDFFERRFVAGDDRLRAARTIHVDQNAAGRLLAHSARMSLASGAVESGATAVATSTCLVFSRADAGCGVYIY